MSDTIIEVVVPAEPTIIEVVVPAEPAVIEVLVGGPQGPAGPDGAPYTGPQITVSSTPPANPAVGDIWIDLN